MAFIREVSIAGFRGFGDRQVLRPSIPRRGEKGSGLTVLVGPNNGGKSAVLEAIDLCARAKAVQLGRDLRNRQTNYFADLAIHYDDDCNWSLASDPGCADRLTLQKHKFRTDYPTLYISNKRALPATVSDGSRERDAYIGSKNPAVARSSEPDNLADRVRRWRRGNSRFAKLLDQVLDMPFRERPESNQLTVAIGGMEHSTSGLGNGIASLLTVIDGISDAPDGSTILIDEPEISLHPSVQRRLFDLLSQESMKLQILYTTHSPYFVGWEAVGAGATVARVSRRADEYSQIHTLTEATAKKLFELTRNINNPHILGSVAREALFLEDGVLLVEGQEDVVIYKRIADELGIPLAGSFFGWGAGGAGNIETIAAMLQELGYREVVGIFDGNESSALKRARKSFPHYEFYSIPADNIRDKSARDEKPAVTGLCSSDGKLRDDHVPVIQTLLNQANAFLKRGVGV